jgi:UDP-glucose 4-epimerase
LSPEFLPPRSVNPVPRRLADVSRAARELGFSATTSLDEGLRRLFQWRREALKTAQAAA